MPKFPPLPSAPFGLATRLPGPEWSRPVDGKTILAELKNEPKDRVTYARTLLSNYNDPLYGETRMIRPEVHGKIDFLEFPFCIVNFCLDLTSDLPV